MSQNIDNTKEFIGFLRNKSNHLLAFIITMGAGISKLFIDGELSVWFWVGCVAVSFALFVYAFLAIIELQNINKLKEK